MCRHCALRQALYHISCCFLQLAVVAVYVCDNMFLVFLCIMSIPLCTSNRNGHSSYDDLYMYKRVFKSYTVHMPKSTESIIQYIGCMNEYRESAVLCHCVILTDGSQTTVTVTVLSVLLSLVLTLSLSTCAVSAVVHAVMYKRLQRCRAELRGGELCSTPQLSHSLL